MLESRTVRCAVLAAIGGAALASTAVTAAPATAVTGPAFVNGGITKDEADVLRQQATHYPLEITLARRDEAPEHNDFIAGAQLRVTDSAGRVVMENDNAGPILLADLPAGSYTIEATYGGQTKTDRVQIASGGHAQVTFLWE